MEKIQYKHPLTAQLEQAITWNHSGKMCGMASLSTSVLLNPHCMERAKNPNSICAKCYASRMMKHRKSLEKKLAKNTEVLTKNIISPEYFPIVNREKFRFEAFGDLNNYIQVVNYFNFAKRNPRTTFALWTKNPWIIQDAIDRGYTKPKNLIVIFSSPTVNACADNIRKLYTFIDKIFTVYTSEETAKEQGKKINCGVRNCVECGRCYSKRTNWEVSELLK